MEDIKRHKFESKTTPGVFYIVTEAYGSMTCECPGYRNSKKTPRHCTHLTQLGVAEPGAPSAEPKQPSMLDNLQSSMPSMPIQVMLASALPEGKTIESYMELNYIMEPKFDGHRRLIEVGFTKTEHMKIPKVTAWSREGNIVALPRHIQETLLALMPAGRYDGEVYLPGGTGTDVKALHLQDQMKLAIFDALEVGDPLKPAMHLSWKDRRQVLELAMSGFGSQQEHVHLALVMVVNKTTLENMWGAGLEGVIVKDIHAVYEPGKRTKSWIKFKQRNHAEVTITGFKKGLLGPHSIVVAQDKAGIEVQVKALNDSWRAAFALDPDSYIGMKMVIHYTIKTKAGKYQQPGADHLIQ